MPVIAGDASMRNLEPFRASSQNSNPVEKSFPSDHGEQPSKSSRDTGRALWIHAAGGGRAYRLLVPSVRPCSLTQHDLSFKGLSCRTREPDTCLPSTCTRVALKARLGLENEGKVIGWIIADHRMGRRWGLRKQGDARILLWYHSRSWPTRAYFENALQIYQAYI